MKTEESMLIERTRKPFKAQLFISVSFFLRGTKIFSVINTAACKTVDHWLFRH